jgi:subtilisin family serine protease
VDISCKEQIMSEEYADFMVDEGNILNAITAITGACYFNLVGNTYNVYVPISNLPRNTIQLYGYGAYPNLYGLLDINSFELSGINRIQSIPALGLRGQGVLIGLVDSGIDYLHEAFRREDGTSKIYSIWDQTIDSEGLQPQRFQYGTEYTQSQINQALVAENPLSVVPTKDEIGHGTFLAGIAAGNRKEEEKFSGIVPDAEIVAVKLKPAKQFLRDFWRIPDGAVAFQKNDFIMGLQYLVQVARQVNRPISIIIGIGTSQGAHDEKGALSRYISSLAAEDGVSISIAGGNEGNTGHHYLGEIINGKVSDLIELNVGPGVSGFTMEFWGQTPTNFSIDIQTPTGEYIPRIPPGIRESRDIGLIFEPTRINVDYQLVESQSGDQLILVRFRNSTEGIWRFQVYTSGNLTLRYHVWLPMENFLSRETYFIRSNPNYTLTSPGNTFTTVVTTAYDYRNRGLYINASRGYLRNENIAPTLASPGVDLIGPAIPSGYKIMSGTSVAAAHAGGICAMLLEWGIVRGNFPQISTVEIRNLLIRGAKRDPNLNYPNQEWGYGILDLFNAFNALRSDII